MPLVTTTSYFSPFSQKRCTQSAFLPKRWFHLYVYVSVFNSSLFCMFRIRFGVKRANKRLHCNCICMYSLLKHIVNMSEASSAYLVSAFIHNNFFFVFSFVFAKSYIYFIQFHIIPSLFVTYITAPYKWYDDDNDYDWWSHTNREPFLSKTFSNSWQIIHIFK